MHLTISTLSHYYDHKASTVRLIRDSLQRKWN